MEWLIIAWLYACGVYSNAALAALVLEAQGEPWTKWGLFARAAMFPVIVPAVYAKRKLMNLI